ncbi:MAG: SAM-dependent DNA methyltransferase [Planctomycetes bacterium]|nr:SAM-dependent DNA methyltransferase [Planctomycetota bacterium]
MTTAAVPRSMGEQDWRGSFIACAEQAMLAWGCPRQGINRPYPLPFPIHRLSQLDLVGFAEPDRQDQETSCYAAHFCEKDVEVSHFHDAARPLATPVMIAGRPGGSVRLSTWTPHGPEAAGHFASLDRFEAYWRQPDAGPRAQEVADRKWARGIAVTQQSLFGAGILDSAFEATADTVPDLYESIVRTCLNRLRKMAWDRKTQRPSGQREGVPTLEDEALWAALLVFGACVLRDKGMLGSPGSDAHTLLQEAASGKFACFFRRSRWSQLPPEELNAIGQGLAEYSFRFLSPYGIGLLYERAFVSKKLREKRAIYYTPVSVANYILGRLPIQDIPPLKRCVADLACGSGTFLHAAIRELDTITGHTAALSNMLPYIWGNDDDRLAAGLTSLSLIMRTGVNGWQVSERDFRDRRLPPAGIRPTIVVGNPPFRLDRSFIEVCLRLLPADGLFGAVLPTNLRDQWSAEEARRHLLSSMDIMEIFELPEGLFAEARNPAMALIARKRGRDGPVSHQVRLGSVGRKEDWWAFQADPRVCVDRVIDQQAWLQRPRAMMTYQTLGTLWSKLAGSPRTLSGVAKMGNGMQFFGRDADLKGVEESDFTGTSNPGGWSPYLSRPHGLVGPYALGWDVHREFIDYLHYHERFHKACKPSTLTCRKAIVPKGTHETTPWRLRACVDDIGLFVTNRLHYMLPRAGAPTIEEIVAVLNSPLASAWYSDNSLQRDIICKNLGRMPFPEFTQDQRDLLIELVRSLHALNAYRLAKGEGLSPARNGNGGSLFPSQGVEHWMIRALTVAVDVMVFEAYGLTSEERRLVLERCPLEARPCFPAPVPAAQLMPVTVRKVAPPEIAGQCLSTCGRVLAVPEGSGLAIVSVDGLDIGIPVPVKVSQLARSARAAGRHFKVKIVENASQMQAIVLAALRPYPEADRPREDIVAHVRDHLQPRQEIGLGGECTRRVP